MKIKDNIEYLNDSIKNKEFLDTRYMALKESDNINEIRNISIKIKELLITIKNLKAKNINCDSFYDDLYNLVISEFGNKNEFNCFINACDSSISIIKNNKELLKDVVDLYLAHRNICEHTPKEWIQAIIDKGAQRKLGATGQYKVIELAQKSGYHYSQNVDDFFKYNYSVAIYSKTIKNKICNSIDFGSQNKDLDIILKSKNNYLFLEAKHIKEFGGAQNQQIKEIIELLNISLPSNIFLASFMDGIFSNYILNISNNEIENPAIILENDINKLSVQKFQLLTYLKENKNSFWVNTYGLIKLLEDFKK